MGFLSDKDFVPLTNNPNVPDEERIVIEPPPVERQIGQCSIDLTLSSEFARFRRWPHILQRRTFDLTATGTLGIQNQWYRLVSASKDRGIKIRPNETVIGISEQYIKLPKTMLGLLTGRSSFSRLGIEVQLTQDL